MRLAKRTNLSVTVLLTLFGLACVLVLPGLPIGRAATTLRAASQEAPSKVLESSRQAALETLYAQFKSGAQFSDEEGEILKKFGAGVTLTDLEADVVISRALFDHYIAGKELTKDQHELLDRYSLSVARRSTDVADLKTHLLNKRKAAAAAAPPRTTPLAAPSNDLCTGAEVIPAAGPFPYLTAVTADVTDATTTSDPPLPPCQNNVSRSIWYTFTPTATAEYTISTCAFDGTSTTLDDTVMAIYTSAGACAGPFTVIPTSGASEGCDDDSCVTEALQAIITTQLNAATQYYIVIWQFDTPPPVPGQTAVQLRVSQVLSPANDTCAGAIALALDTPVNGTTSVAADDYQLSGSGCFTGVGQTASTAPGGDVVYSFTAPSAGNYSFKVTNYDTIRNLVLYVATTCPAGTPPVTVSTCLAAANRQLAGTSEDVNCVALSSGQQVFVFVDESSATTGSSFTIEVNSCVRETEPNDTPATANAFVCGIEGTINLGAEADFFSLGSAAAGSRLFAMIDGVASNSADFDMRVTTATDTLQYDDFSNAAQFGGLSPNVAGTPLTGAPAFLRVDSFPAVASEPYRVYAVVQPPSASATIETEPNNVIGTANAASNDYFTGSLAGPAPSTDIDLFSFTANSGDLIFLSLDCDPARDATPIDGALALLDSAGTELVMVSNGDSTSSTASGAGSLTSTTPNSPSEGLVWRARTTGTYYAKVLIGTSSAGAAGAGDYLLSISRNCVVRRSLFDFDGDNKTDIAVWHPGDGTWYIINSSNGSTRVVQWGASGQPFNIPVAGDYDGDGKADIAVWHPGDGTWFIINSSNGSTRIVQWGASGQPFNVPVPADYDGDGKTDIAVWHPGDGTWYIINSSNGSTRIVQWGASGQPFNVPVPADYDGDGKADIAVWHPGDGTWFIINSSNGSTRIVQWGASGQPFNIPVPGDYDRDGRADIAVWHPGDGTWYIINSSDGSVRIVQWGSSPEPFNVPVPGDYDADGKTDIAVWHPGDGTWYIVNSSNGSIRIVQWGASGLPYNIPVPGR